MLSTGRSADCNVTRYDVYIINIYRMSQYIPTAGDITSIIHAYFHELLTVTLVDLSWFLITVAGSPDDLFNLEIHSIANESSYCVYCKHIVCETVILK